MATGAIEATPAREMVEARYPRRRERAGLGARSDAPAPLPASPSAIVSLRSVKEVAHKLSPSHPLRILLLGEPDQMPVAEFASKVGGWLRLLPTERS